MECLRIVLIFAAMLGFVAWVSLVSFGLAFCEAYNCDPSVPRKYLLTFAIQLVAVGGFIWTLARNRPHMVRNAAIWLAVAVLFAYPGWWLYAVIALFVAVAAFMVTRMASRYS